jgi:murein DD-endopeptidase MepM/ murein hydrolase activator NlpD
MKKSLREELERIHTITYGKQVVTEEGFLDNINKKLNSFLDSIKVDEPKKADFVSNDVEEFYKNLEDSIKKGGLSQQQRGSMSYQKEVETMQIGLMLLGYDLPKHGIDGLFGPETARAVTKFSHENLEDKPDQINEAVTLIGDGSASVIGNPGQGTHNQTDWQSRNAWDISGNVGSDVFSITDGTVEKIRKDSGFIKSGTKKIYGDQIRIRSNNGPDVFYTHINSNLSQGQSVKIGDVIGKIVSSSGIPPHVHIALSSGNIKDYANVSGKASDGTGGNLTKATPEMLTKLLELLQIKGITSEDLKTLIDLERKVGSLEGIAASDFVKMNNLIIDKLEGGYYHPKMLSDGRVKDSRYGGSGETMFGMDRKTGEWESRTQEGKMFFKILDDADASNKWPWNYMGGEYASRLKELSAEMIKREYLNNTKQYLSTESQQIINGDAKLTFNFIYATYNGPGWFQRFAKVINEAVNNGTTNPEELNKIFIERRKGSSNSLIAQGGRKMDGILGSSVV